MLSVDERLHLDNIKLCIRLNMFHLLKRTDLEDELIRLTEKRERYVELISEYNRTTDLRIDQIKMHLKKRDSATRL